MANVTRAELIDATRDEFGDDDAIARRTIDAIANVDLRDLANVTELVDIDETTCDDATLVALALDYHYGIGFDLVD